MEASILKQEEVWYVDLGASKHMTNHEEWFTSLRKLEQLGYIETDDDTIHTIEHIGDVPLSHVGQRGCIKNTFHVSTITKNLVSVSKIVYKGMQVRFNKEGCFIEDDDRLIARGRREGHTL